MPFKNDFVNEEWISDKIRFGFDTLKRQRLSKPLIKDVSMFFQISWTEIFDTLTKKFDISRNKNINFDLIVGPFCDLKTSFFIKNLLKLSINKDRLLSFENVGLSNIDFQSYYSFNNRFQVFDNSKLEACLLIGVDTKKEVPILNLKLRKRFLKGNFIVANFGSKLNLTFPVFHLATNCFSFFSVISGNHFFCKILKKKKTKIVLVGNSFLSICSENKHRFFISSFLQNSGFMNSEFFGFNFLSKRASDLALYHLGIKTKNLIKTLKPNFLIVLGDTIFQKNNKNSFICYNGIQGNNFALKSNLILPSLSFVEKNSLFVNTEGRFQNAQKAISGPKNAKLDFEIIFNFIKNLDGFFDKKLKTNFLLRQNKIPFFKDNKKPFFSSILKSGFMNKTKITNKNIVTNFNDNFYQTNLILKNSVIMAKSSKTLLLKSPFL